MDDETRAAAQLQLSNNIAPGCSSLTTQLTNYNQCPSGPEFGEPKPKKRCFRAPSDFSDEDPSLVSDSGFCDLPLYPNGLGECNQNQNGDQEVGPFFDVGKSCDLLFLLLRFRCFVLFCGLKLLGAFLLKVCAIEGEFS